MKFAFIALASTALVTVPAYAQTTPAPAPAATPKPERLICREDNEIGSLTKKQRICLTATQWREQGHRAGMELERREAQRPGSGGG